MSQCWSLKGHKGVQSQSQCRRVFRDTKVCSVSMSESLEGHKGVQCVRVSVEESDRHIQLQTLKHIYQKHMKMSPIKLEPTDRKI